MKIGILHLKKIEKVEPGEKGGDEEDRAFKGEAVNAVVDLAEPHGWGAVALGEGGLESEAESMKVILAEDGDPAGGGCA